MPILKIVLESCLCSLSYSGTQVFFAKESPMGLLSRLTRRISARDKARGVKLVELIREMDRAAETGAGEELKTRRAELRAYLESLAGDAEPEALKLSGTGYFDLASSLREAGEFADAESCYAAAEVALSTLAEHKRYAEFARAQLAACRNHIGLLNLEQADYPKAAAAFDQAIAMREEVARRSPKDQENLVFLGGALCNRGIAAREMGQITAARQYFEKSQQTLDPLVSGFDCGSAEALAEALSRMTGSPHWLLLAFQFKKTAMEGLASLGGPVPEA